MKASADGLHHAYPQMSPESVLCLLHVAGVGRKVHDAGSVGFAEFDSSLKRKDFGHQAFAGSRNLAIAEGSERIIAAELVAAHTRFYPAALDHKATHLRLRTNTLTASPHIACLPALSAHISEDLWRSCGESELHVEVTDL